ncbi:hypothetical protein [Streptomyces sp. NPDC096030]|uniref:hypothetical protein n=1 Tax=Streptomyces sp. NPDC096030 TaxID=3155423 RepID=UPI003319AD4A
MADQDPVTEAAAPTRTAVYINRRTVVRLDFPMAHTMRQHNDGWRITFDAPGKVRVITNAGHNDQIDVKVGDLLLSSGEDFFFSIQQVSAAAVADSAAKGEAR